MNAITLLHTTRNLTMNIEHQILLSYLSKDLIKTHKKTLERKNALSNMLKELDKTSALPEDADTTKREKREKKFLNMIKNETNNNFYTINANTLTFCWTYLESTIYNLVRNYLECNKEFTKITEFNNIEITIDSYVLQNEQNILDAITESYIEKQSKQKKYGFQRFESILKPILGKSKLDSQYANTLFHLAQTRNLIVHKNGVVDKKFITSSDKKGLKIGEKINFNENDIFIFTEAIIKYVDDICNRIETLT